MAIIRLEGVSKRYTEASRAVNNLSLEVEAGEILAILGPSGCGKTTTLRLIAGFERPDMGRVSIAERLVAGDGHWVPPEARGVGMVFQDYALFPHLTVAENVAFGLRAERPERERRVEEVLGLVGLGEFHGRYPHELSGGQQQRVALARALAPRPVVVLLDEPFSNLDPDLRAQMRRDVHGILRCAKSTSILVTHDQEEAFSIADRIAVLNGGRIEQVGTPEEIYHTPTTRFVAKFVGQADFLPGTVEKGGIATEVGFFSVPINLPSSTVVEVMIRPDDINIGPSEAGIPSIVMRQFRGSENLYTIELPSGQMVHSVQPSTVVHPVGTKVSVEANPSHIVIFFGERAIGAATRGDETPL